MENFKKTGIDVGHRGQGPREKQFKIPIKILAEEGDTSW